MYTVFTWVGLMSDHNEVHVYYIQTVQAILEHGDSAVTIIIVGGIT